MQAILSVAGVDKTYAGGFQALKGIDLEIRRGEIFALLGPNGAGKTTLISIICGIVNASAGQIRVDGHDIVRDYRAARSLIGLVPQELTTDAFETVWNAVSFSRGLFGKAADPAHIEKTLRALSLWDKKDNRIMTLSGGMKRRMLIAKALSHEPQLLFLDEPTAGVDVELRRDMWALVRQLRDTGVTIMIPMNNVEQVGLRRIMDAKSVRSIYKILRTRDAGVDPQPWNRRYRQYMDKLKSGSPFEIAEVLRNLLHLKGEKVLSFGERKMLDTARSLLAKEISIARSVTEEVVEADLRRFLNL